MNKKITKLVKATALTIVGMLWLFVVVMGLSTIDLGPDINILEVDRHSESIVVSVAPDVPDDELFAWVSKECRDAMVLPPVTPAAVVVWLRIDRQTGRNKYRFNCTRSD